MIPKLMEITTKIGCSLNCRFCPKQLLIESYFNGKKKEKQKLHAENMSFEVFQRCIDKIPLDTDIHFSGMCEPWLNPDCTKMLCYAYEKGHNIHVYTTLVGMTREDYMQLKELDISTFVLHIPDEEGNSRFQMDEDYLEFLSEVIQDVKNGIFTISSFSCHGTVHSKIRQLVDSSGIRINNQMYDRAGNVQEECDIKSGDKKRGSIICKWCGGISLDKNVLLPDGTVLMCCMDYGMKYPLGNLLQESYEDISEGNVKMQYRRLLMEESDGDILCRTCHRSRKLP